MNHKILEQIKGGGFLAGDLPMSTSSYYNDTIAKTLNNNNFEYYYDDTIAKTWGNHNLF
jgi:hypothetical protein